MKRRQLSFRLWIKKYESDDGLPGELSRFISDHVQNYPYNYDTVRTVMQARQAPRRLLDALELAIILYHCECGET